MYTGRLTLGIDSRLDHVRLVGLSVHAIAATVFVDDDAAGAVELCVVEAVNNCIEHAYRGEAGHVVEIVLQVSPDALQVEVADRGASMDWPQACARAAAFASDCYAEGGRGIFIIRSLMDDVRYAHADGRNVLTLVKRTAMSPTSRAGAGQGSPPG